MSKEAMKLALEGAANYIDALGGDSRKYRQTLASEAKKPDFWEGYVPEPVKPAQQEPEHTVSSNRRYSPLLTHMMNKRVKSNLKQVIELYDSPEQPAPVASPHEQEPVAWVRLEAWKSGAEWPDDCFTDAHADGLVPLYTTPPAAQLAPMQEPVGWVNHANIASAVVERERGGSGDTHTWSESKTAYHTVPFYTTPQPQQAEKQEPVAWIDGGDLELMRKHGRGCIAWGTQQNNANTPLYTTPPAAAQQQWTGLTDEEIEKGRDQTFSINNPYCPCNSKTMRKAVRWAEAKLKEKNT